MTTRTQGLAGFQPLVARGIVRLRCGCKGEIGERVFVGTEHPGRVWQARESLQRGVELFSRPSQQATATGAEQGVTRKEHVTGEVGDVGCGMAWNREHVEAHPQFRQRDLVPFRNLSIHARDRLISGAINRDIRIGLAQFAQTTGVIGMVVGDEDGTKLQRISTQPFAHRSRITRIDHQRVISHPQSPDIVILKSG